MKCKKCGVMVRTKARTDGPSSDDTATTVQQSEPTAAEQPNAFDFSKPTDEDNGLFQLPYADSPAPAPAPIPTTQSGPDANASPLPPGYPYPAPGTPVPPGYPAPPPGYPAGTYPPHPGYGPPPGYPYGPPPGYPYALPPGYGLPVGYPAPPGYPQPAQAGYAPPPGYPYPQAVPAPAPTAPASAVAQPLPAAPAKVAPDAPVRPGAKPKPARPIQPSDEFKTDSGDAHAPTSRRGRYQQRRGNKGKFVWIGVSLVLTAGLVAGVVYGARLLSPSTPVPDTKPEGDANANTKSQPPPTSTAYPRRILFISVTKYMYLNPLTAGQQGAPDRIRGAAYGLAFQWRVPQDKENNQVFLLSDTTTGAEERLPMKNVVQGAYQEFCKTSRGQDRVLIYFGGHAIEKDGKAYLAPMEAELDGEDWEKTLIPLSDFYAELGKCKAAQKVVIWDVCRLNPEKGKVRPGSEVMSPGLFKALTTPPAGVQIITTCKDGENAMEFSQLRPDGFSGPVYSGSAFLESAKFVSAPSNGRLPKASPAQPDPFPITEWHPAVARRTVEMGDIAEKVGSGGKQTVTLTGTPPTALPPPDGAEKIAARFDMPKAPKGASQAEIKGVEGEFNLPALKPGLGDVGLADFPFPADIMKDYAEDVKLAEIIKDKEKYKLRNAVLDTTNKLRDKWSTGAGTTKIRDTVVGPINDMLKNEVKREQEFWAVSIAELELELFKLDGLKDDRKDEPSKRWQAHYDFALASIKARLAYMNEYNKLLGNLVTESLPPLDAKLGQDGYTLVASDILKSGKDVKAMAEQAQTLFGEIIVKYKGSPWAIQAKQEKAVAIGLNWKPASLKKEP